MPADDGRILLVCAANVCRSPMASFTLRESFSRHPGFGGVPLQSAGVHVDEERPVCAEVQAFHDDKRWRELAADHRSRALTEASVLRASLVLAASSVIRSSIVAKVPEHRRRVFTLREAVWLGAEYEWDPALRGPEAVAAFQLHIDGQRGLRQPPARPRRLLGAAPPPDPLDIPDGHTLRGRAHLRAVRAVDRASRELAALIAGPERGRH